LKFNPGRSFWFKNPSLNSQKFYCEKPYRTAPHLKLSRANCQKHFQQRRMFWKKTPKEIRKMKSWSRKKLHKLIYFQPTTTASRKAKIMFLAGFNFYFNYYLTKSVSQEFIFKMGKDDFAGDHI
jgi:hypothetical protein